MKEQIITQQVIGREVGSHMALSKDDETKFYEEHKERSTSAEQIRLSEILVQWQIQTTRPRKIQKLRLRRKSRRKACWPRSAREQNSKTSPRKIPMVQPPTQGGDLGYFKRGTLAKVLEDQTFAMKPGEVSDANSNQAGICDSAGGRTPGGRHPSLRGY